MRIPREEDQSNTLEILCHGNMTSAEVTQSQSRDGEGARRFRVMYQSYYGRIAAYALRRTETREDAADVVAETFEIAWRRMATIPVGDAELLWLYGVARRVLANQRRSSLRRKLLVQKVALDLPVSDVDVKVDSSGILVKSVLKQMSSSDQELLALAYWEDLSPKEIAVILAISSGAVRVRLLRARRRFGEAFKEMLDYGPGTRTTKSTSASTSVSIEETGGA